VGVKVFIALGFLAVTHSVSAQAGGSQAEDTQSAAPSADVAQPNAAAEGTVTSTHNQVISLPAMPAEMAGPANDYFACLTNSIMGKMLKPPVEPTFEAGVQSCAETRARNEQIARTSEADGWPAAGTPERATAAKALFDGIEESFRSAGRDMAAQFLQSSRPIKEIQLEPATH